MTFSRNASMKRQTKETDIEASLNIDGSAISKINSSIGFLDHMLDQLAFHGNMDIELKAKGDLHIDMHHTVEDIGIILGKLLKEAMGERKGIKRYATFHIPMDECLSRVSIDVSGRPYLVWNVEFSKNKLGEFDTELVEEWFRAFAFNAGLTLHVENLYGKNNHHICESLFKALARALKEALSIDPLLLDKIPSSKGMLDV